MAELRPGPADNHSRLGSQALARRKTAGASGPETQDWRGIFDGILARWLGSLHRLYLSATG